MARDATARLYDVDLDSVLFKKLQRKERYDQGTITFHARKGRLIDLDKLHESIWATRLSGGTRSGLVSLEVTAIGKLAVSQDKAVLAVSGSDGNFILRKHPEDEYAPAYDRLKTAAGNQLVKVTGEIVDYRGRWPDVLGQQPPKIRELLVTKLEMVE